MAEVRDADCIAPTFFRIARHRLAFSNQVLVRVDAARPQAPALASADQLRAKADAPATLLEEVEQALPGLGRVLREAVGQIEIPWDPRHPAVRTGSSGCLDCRHLRP